MIWTGVALARRCYIPFWDVSTARRPRRSKVKRGGEAVARRFLSMAVHGPHASSTSFCYARCFSADCCSRRYARAAPTDPAAAGQRVTSALPPVISNNSPSIPAQAAKLGNPRCLFSAGCQFWLLFWAPKKPRMSGLCAWTLFDSRHPRLLTPSRPSFWREESCRSFPRP
jgi:hypothetical protein